VTAKAREIVEDLRIPRSLFVLFLCPEDGTDGHDVVNHPQRGNIRVGIYARNGRLRTERSFRGSGQMLASSKCGNSVRRMRRFLSAGAEDFIQFDFVETDEWNQIADTICAYNF
jgi:hypothetical protein